ncbi:MAG TPA: glycosyltransferase [Candidatus Poseidoniales archaeon]|nr:MAG: hypothetical protein CXT69_03845 [Euryarchaeota archaeon]HIG02759.1 glycosyltransferase [Candidatus Poseidoniales archaeon]HIK78205.1 glycosyltransferase [Candidatus Poseidoniales archaeon]
MGIVIAYMAAIQLGLGALSATPFLYHRYKIGKWLMSAPPLSIPNVDESLLPQISLVLPLWNEELVVERKLADIAKQEYPSDKLQLIIIDSASTDSTLSLVEEWLKKIPKQYLDVKVIKMPSRQGKTAAIQKAFLSADIGSEVFAMTDADAMLNEGALMRMGAWFTNDDIGAVGGIPQRFSVNETRYSENESRYRDLFSMQRLAESMIDSTPFLEGSIMGIRSSLFNEDTLNVYANADDAQLAIAARMAGYRSIIDKGMSFIEPIPPTRHEYMQQKVRRAQGLQRLLFKWRKKRVGAKAGLKQYSSILKWLGFMHIEVPWMVTVGSLLAILKWVLVIISQSTNPFILATMVLDVVVYGGWFARIGGLKIPGTELIATFMDSMYALLKAQLLLLRGKSLHLWPQGKGVREAWAKEK